MCPQVQSRAESDLSEGIPMGGRHTGGGQRGGSGRLGGVWGQEEEVEEADDGSEQRVVLEGNRVYMLVTYFSTLKLNILVA